MHQEDRRIAAYRKRGISFCMDHPAEEPRLSECPRYIPGCSVVAINPQIFLEKYPYSEELEKITGMKLRTEPDRFIRNDNCRIIRENRESLYFLIENVRSDGDYLTQLRAFCRQADIDPGFGIEKNGNVVTWLYDAQGRQVHILRWKTLRSSR